MLGFWDVADHRWRRAGGRADALEIGHRHIDTRRVPRDPTLSEIGAAHGKTAGQVAPRWLLDQELVSPIPKASSHARRVENFDVFDFALSADERARIDALPKDERTADPPWAPDWDAWRALRCLPHPGAVAEWLRSGLQSRVHRFDSGRRL
jgi:diketogulonate reductase-like aldo/keto reductase